VIDPVVVELPREGVWRVGRAPDPFAWSQPEPVDTSDPGRGNRFDSFHGDYGVCYFGTSPEACFAETLARFRPVRRLADLVRAEWSGMGLMEPGNVPADWRDSRILARASTPDALPFIDVSAPESVEAFRFSPRIAAWLEASGVVELDLSTVVGADRRVTRLISQWAFDAKRDDEFLYSGIRYVSRLGAEYECWAVFPGKSDRRARAPARTPDQRRLVSSCRPLRAHGSLTVVTNL
jgi:hypothetical protein